MITFNYETSFELKDENLLEKWIENVVSDQEFSIGEINYIFCDDAYLHKLNVQFLNHDTLTDIISFDYSIGKNLQGDIFISVERVTENAKEFKVSFQDELDGEKYDVVLLLNVLQFAQRLWHLQLLRHSTRDANTLTSEPGHHDSMVSACCWSSFARVKGCGERVFFRAP